MKIALVRQRYTPFGGAERFVSRAMEALQRQGAEITLITRRWGPDGNLNAEGFRMTDEGARLYLLGKSRVILYETKEQ